MSGGSSERQRALARQFLGKLDTKPGERGLGVRDASADAADRRASKPGCEIFDPLALNGEYPRNLGVVDLDRLIDDHDLDLVAAVCRGNVGEHEMRVCRTVQATEQPLIAVPLLGAIQHFGGMGA